jgi:XRE family aerobic/anaerobic benzoate catabolism transcriptional regulator
VRNIVPTGAAAAHHSAQPVNHHPFLRELGRRLRAARLERGLSLAELAEQAEVSRRYLTDAEAGRANPSALVLVRLSAALALPLRQWLDIPLRGRGGERVALVGLRGAGKSTVGPRLALALEVPFVELDLEVEREAGLALGQLFDLHGPAAFHRYEREALERVLGQGERVVLAAGGSIVDEPSNYERLLDTCRTVWLHARPQDHFERVRTQGDTRPMRDRPRAFAELEALLGQRRSQYARCELHLDTHQLSPEQAVERILAWIAGP